MAELRWIQTCFSLILLLQVTAVTGLRSSSSYITVRAGDDVTLSCADVIDGQHECDGTDWSFSGSTDTNLVRRGKIVVEDNPRSDRLSVLENCSLVLKKVSDGDASRFECDQIRSGAVSHSNKVYLSVVTMTKQTVGEDVTLTCSMSSHGPCSDKVKWLLRGYPIGKDHRDLKTSQSGCSATVSFSKTHYISNSFNDILKCEVMVGSSEIKHQFSFSPRSSAVTGQVSYVISRRGDDATLSCGNISQSKCVGTTWSFSSSSRSVELISRGQIGSGAQDQSDRLNLTENCGLVLKNVSREDVGQYGCEPTRSSERRQGPEFLVHLFLLDMTEEKSGDKVQLYCSLFRHGRCLYSLKWLYDGPQAGYTIMDNNSHDCSASVAFTSTDLHQSKYKEFFKCQVTYANSGNVVNIYTFPEASGETDPVDPKGEGATDESGGSSWWKYVVGVVSLALLLIIAVALIMRRKSKGNKTQTHDSTRLSLNPAETEPAPQTSQDTVDPEDGVAYASVSYTKNSKSPAKVQAVDDDDTVTYSTVKTSSAGPSNVYATVNKPNESNAGE